ncbi:recombinase family protein [Streptomyces sp. NPDC002055]|uniref:recombinase family protein n=1 Tax=Streptomyces sp. NPDC002055 TaxID=3154534 RepID=UPI00331CB4D4
MADKLLVDLYLRKSKNLREDDHRREQSTDTQEASGRRWADRNGYTVRNVWVDLASGYKADAKRPDFDKALAALRNRETSALWCYMVDRFSRQGARAVLDVIDPAGGTEPGRLIFEYDNLDSANERDKRWILNRAMDAKEYSDQLSARTRDTKQQQREDGQWVTAQPPYGYRVEIIGKRRQLVPDPDPAKIVQEIFRRVSAGESARTISRDLNARGIPGPSGGAWRHAAISRTISHPAYAGWQVIKEGRRLVAYRNEAGERVGLRTELVDEAGQRHAQGVAAGKVRPLAGDGTPGAGKASHLLTDLLRCDGCKRAMTFRGLSYKCEKERACGICPAPASAYADALEREVVGRWLNVVMALEPTDALAVKIAERWTALTLPEETEEARGAREALAAAESSLGRLMADRQAGLYDGPAARYFAPLHRDAIDAVEAAQKHLDAVAPRAVIDTSIVDDGHLLRETWEAAELDMRRSLLRLAIDRVTARKAPYQGARWDGESRVTVEWAAGEGSALPTDSE